MLTKEEYLTIISKRGDAYGWHGGILDLLMWCDKLNTMEVTLEEARLFCEHPELPCEAPAVNMLSDIKQNMI